MLPTIFVNGHPWGNIWYDRCSRGYQAAGFCCLSDRTPSLLFFRTRHPPNIHAQYITWLRALVAHDEPMMSKGEHSSSTSPEQLLTRSDGKVVLDQHRCSSYGGMMCSGDGADIKRSTTSLWPTRIKFKNGGYRDLDDHANSRWSIDGRPENICHVMHCSDLAFYTASIMIGSLPLPGIPSES